MTRCFSFFEGAGSTTGAGLTTSGCGAGGGGAGSTTGTGAATAGRDPGHEQPAVQTSAMSKHIRKMIFLFIEITALVKMSVAYLCKQVRPFSSFVKKKYGTLLFFFGPWFRKRPWKVCRSRHPLN
jgi:hypothetical protein